MDIKDHGHYSIEYPVPHSGQIITGQEVCRMLNTYKVQHNGNDVIVLVTDAGQTFIRRVRA